MRKTLLLTAGLACAGLAILPLAAPLAAAVPPAAPPTEQQAMPADCPLHAAHQKAQAETPPADPAAGHDHAQLDRRGDRVMGFEHVRTTHHFMLQPDGGIVRVEADDPADTASIARIRTHLAAVARAFAAGDFAMPGEIHDRTLPGVPEMIRLTDEITYRYEELERGGQVRIATADPEALAAVHAFLRAQIADHRTGDEAEPAADGG